MEHGYLLLAAGDLQEGRTALLRALTGLPPSEATLVIQFTGLMGRVSEEGARALAEAGVRAHRGEEAAGARTLAEAVDGLPSEERAPLLAEAARMASSVVPCSREMASSYGHPRSCHSAAASAVGKVYVR